MMKNKALLSLLLCGLMLYYAVPRLVVDANSTQGMFSLAWLLLAVLVIGGNLSSLLYAPKKFQARRKNIQHIDKKTSKKQIRQRG
ncbi:hypothetical protein ACFOU2_06710 [Bacillus songklensis]|uniref:Uncharacterized protein n=1 Tax=Bacillus songklensis TaxID=1069116 RepID=A0ABV8B014_9BACI